MLHLCLSFLIFFFINFLPPLQCTLSFVYKFQSNTGRDYLEEIFPHASCNGFPTRYSHQKLNRPHRKTNQGLRVLSYIGPSLWNNLNNFLKTSVSLNTFKHNYKEHFFQKASKN